ncbi:hypothetical protein JRQ81_016617, partial [Phrynocephalus forsythii]
MSVNQLFTVMRNTMWKLEGMISWKLLVPAGHPSPPTHPNPAGKICYCTPFPGELFKGGRKRKLVN